MLGAAAMYAVDAGGAAGFFQGKIKGAWIGFVIMLFIYRWDYRKLELWSGKIYLIALLLAALVWNVNADILYQSAVVIWGPFLLDWLIVSFLLVCSAAGQLRVWREGRVVLA